MGNRITWNSAGSTGTGSDSVMALNGMRDVYTNMIGGLRTPDILTQMGKNHTAKMESDAVGQILQTNPENKAAIRSQIINDFAASKRGNIASVLSDSSKLFKQRVDADNAQRIADAEIASKLAFAGQANTQVKKSTDLAKAEELLPGFIDSKTGRIQTKAYEKAGREFDIPGASMNAAAKEHRDISGISASSTAQLLADKYAQEEKLARLRAGFKGSTNTDFLSGSQAPNWRIFTSDPDAVAENEVLYNKYPMIPAITRRALILKNFSKERVLDRAAADSALNVENERLGAIREAEKAGTK